MWGRKSFDQQVEDCIAVLRWRNPNERDCPDYRRQKLMKEWQKEKLKALAKFPQNVQEVARQMLRH